jgi:hypothetical protein
MSATTHLFHLVPDHARREGYLTRLRVRARRTGLDRRLAAGEDPRADVDLRLRADELTEPDARQRIADTIQRLIAEAAGPPSPSAPRPRWRAPRSTPAPRA